MSGAFDRFADAGYDRLVPIMPPDAPLHPASFIARRLEAGEDVRGKVPGTRGADGLWRGLDLTRMEATPSDLDVWDAMGAGVGLRMGAGLVALDIDTLDADASARIATLAAEHLGPSAPRIGRAPKTLMLYRVAEGEDPGYRGVRFRTDTEDAALVELLGEGRQAVGHGIHPTTHAPYEWPMGLPARGALPEVTTESLKAFFDHLAASLPDARTTVESAGKPRHDIDQNRLRGDADLIRRAVEATPNAGATFNTREAYLRMGYAIKAAIEADAEAFETWAAWCDRWEDGTNDPAVLEADWRRMKLPYSLGADYVYDMAERHGGFTGRAEQFFQPVTGTVDPASGLDDMFAQNRKAERGPGYALLSLDDVRDMPDPTFLIDRLIPTQGFGLLYGDPGSGKSFISLDMALSIAHGLPDWHGDAIDGARPGGVLYIAGEGASGYKLRIEAWKRGRLTPQRDRPPAFRFLFQPVNFMRPDDVTKLLETLRHSDLGPLSLVVVDTVSRAIPGADENMQKDMTTFVAACDAIRQQTGAFVLGIHHTSKAGGMRGSSVFLGQADVVLRLDRKKGSGTAFLMCEKQKDAPDGWQDAYRMETVQLGQPGEERSSLVPRRLRADEVSADARMDAETAGKMLRVITEAWEAGEPLSASPQARGRYAPAVIAPRLGLDAVEVRTVIDLWCATGALVTARAQGHGGLRGLRVAEEPGSNPGSPFG